jgi:ABC-type dipeptide/oligopeptide/nickel transport system permease subunit
MYAGELDRIFSRDFLLHLTLPALTIALYLQGLPLLLMRSTMIEAMHEEFVTMARMKGLSEWRIVIHHAARNSLLPVLTAFALAIGPNISANVVVETVFSWPGLGRLLVQAVSTSDYPLAQGAFFLIALVVIVMNLVADLLYGFLDPRVVAWPLTSRAPPSCAGPRSGSRQSRTSRAPPPCDPYTVAGLSIYVVFILVALFADALATHDPTEILFRANGRVAANRPLGEGFILGTTNLGRDIYSQLVYGSRSALMVGLTAAVFVVAIGTLTGLLSGYFGGSSMPPSCGSPTSRSRSRSSPS